jgi:hypothetical protein
MPVVATRRAAAVVLTPKNGRQLLDKSPLRENTLRPIVNSYNIWMTPLVPDGEDDSLN